MHLPRLVIAGLSGDAGKTIVSLGLVLLARRRGLSVAAFKKGPDYIDAAWLGWAAGRPAHNLDTFLMGPETVQASFARYGLPEAFNLIEGNRGLYDGVDAAGTHSTATLARLLAAPVVLVVSPAKATRTVAALVLGCQKLDPEVRLAGVILNRVSSARQEQVIRQAIEAATGIPVVGVLPRAPSNELVVGRHLGLVTPAEHPAIDQVGDNLLSLVGGGVDLEAILGIASSAPALAPPPAAVPRRPAAGPRVPIGHFSDSAFTFYYPENLEALEAAGADLVALSALENSPLPRNLAGLYIGGGFPETHGAVLSANRTLLADLKERAAQGLPIYAECGGLMLLAEAIRYEGRRYPMAGVLPFEVEVMPRPQGHGYALLTVDGPNPFFSQGTRLRGHEFHYSQVVLWGEPPPTACAVERGTGCFPGRDAVVAGNVWASYTHLHALATPEWADGLVAAARRYAGGLR